MVLKLRSILDRSVSREEGKLSWWLYVDRVEGWARVCKGSDLGAVWNCTVVCIK